MSTTASSSEQQMAELACANMPERPRILIGGISRTKAALHPGGRVVFWSANPDRDFAKSLEKDFKNVECISAKSYPKAKRFTHTLFVADRD